MTLNGVIALILYYFTELDNFGAVLLLGEMGGGGRPPRLTPSRGGWYPDESLKIFVAEFSKNTGETITWKAESVGVVAMIKKGHYFCLRTQIKKRSSPFWRKSRVTPSFTALGETSLNDASALHGDYVTVVEDRLIMSAVDQNW